MAESMIESLKRERGATMTDRISSLPDSLLHHILSFLPTKQAVATSLLSKRWRPLWLSLSTLDFDDGSFLKNKTFDFRFVQFVDAALMLRDLEPIERFRLNCGSFCLPSNINIWIKAAIKRKVERLELFFPPFYVCLSSSIFICITIRVLKLKGVKVNTLSSVYLPSLKVLHLESVGFSNFKCVAMLLSGCTLLEDLVLKCVIASVDPSSGSIKGLRQLVKADVPPLLIPLEAFCNVKFLCLNEGTWIPSDEIPIFHNLTHMEFTCFIYDWNWLVKWIQNCPKLQILVIHKIACGFNNCDKEERLMEPKLQCLSSHLKEFYIRQYEGSECELQLARLIMKNARFLRTITICSTNYSNANAKIEMIKRLSSCSRGSMNCRLLFN